MAQETVVRHKRGGIYFDDFVVGHLYEHPLTRTVTQMDNMLFSNMTLNPQPLHIDRHFCEQETEWGQPLMNSLFTLGLMIGIMVNDLSVGTTIANLGMTEVKFPHPLFEGDTVHCTTEVIGKREFELAPGRRHRRVPPPRLQSGQQAGGRVPPPGLHADAAEIARGAPAGALRRPLPEIEHLKAFFDEQFGDRTRRRAAAPACDRASSTAWQRQAIRACRPSLGRSILATFDRPPASH